MAGHTYSNAFLNASTDGLSRLAAALGGGQQTHDDAMYKRAELESRIAQEIAASHAHDSVAAKNNADVAILGRRPDIFSEQVASAAGTDIPTVDAYRKQLRTGAPATMPMGPPTEQGQMGATPLPAAMTTNIGRALQQFLPLLSNSGDLKPDDLAAAAKTFRSMGLSDDIIAGNANRNTVGGAQAAVEGKPIYNTNGDGAVLDQYGGGLDTSNPLARSTIGLRGAQAGEASARAGLARAQAGDVVAGKYDPASGTVIDVRAHTATPVLGPDGKPIGGKGGSLNQEQANALTFASRMQAADKTFSDLAGMGVTMPGMVHRVAGSLPWVGDAAAAATNGTQSDKQQQVEQAQRDFINAVLRRESGAAISSGEFANAAQQYFPQPGDGKPVLAQKAAARARVIQGMLAAVPPGQRNLPDLPGATAAAGAPISVDY